ncbi:MAG: hypothetical protein SXQ77_04755, partial [Halobacteria archaeon]|nr:hypothetical protein [Halobacteria archaeon]
MILAIILIVVVVGLAFMIVGATMQFVLIDSLRNREIRIRSYFSRWFGKGIRLFLFQLALFLILVLPMAILGVLFVLALGVGSIFLFLLMIPFFFIFLIIMGIISNFTVDLVAPIMMVDDKGVVGG